jgi:hypothetical protein
MAGIKLEISNIERVLMQISGQQKVLAKALEATTKDFKSRAPSKISKRIREVYGVKTADIKATQKGARTNGTINVAGINVDNVELAYSGRLLTPTHFNMTPKTRPASKKYTVKATIKKGHKTVLSSRTFLASPGKKKRRKTVLSSFLALFGGKREHKTGKAGSIQIPFQRVGTSRYPIKAIKTLSVPQMITNETDGVAENISKDINELLNSRLEHNIKRFEAKAR